ncbi:SusC/RagA family TonB-linked outer membrane protein [Flavicella marina]|uniref:SusC/RagA family TonB-linked outer membrane protein n=1 Tax=Flavicella marina TaxID=1475951 RepID=UPI001264ADF4|nr:SusC/RagA family TonB-linked outer membrane protein [Flavicella marina]
MKNFTSVFLVFFLSISMYAQVNVHGVVKDNNGEPLPGATVLEKGAPNGTTTDFDGNFEITTRNETAKLLISFVGFETKEISVTTKETIEIQLALSSESLEEVVVIGYGTSTKSDVTASITTVKPITDDKAGVAAVESLLRGTSGMNVVSNGEPGAAVSINIRGVSSLTGSNQPLYVIDGIVMDSSQEFLTDPTNFQGASKSGIGGVAPEDIESIQILKDASATAIYGSLGANGVILISTKQGKLGAPKFNFSTSTTVGQPILPYKILDTEQFVAHANDKYRLNPDSNAGPEYQYPDGRFPFEIREDGLYNFIANRDDDNDGELDLIGIYEPMDWTSLYRTTYSTNTRFTASGGTENTKYYSSVGYLSQEGVLANAYLNKLDLNINGTHRINKNLKLGAKVAYSHTVNSLPGGSGSNAGEINSVYRHINDNFPLELREDLAPLGDERFRLTPRGWVEDYDNISTENRVIGNFSVDYKLRNDLVYNFKFGGDYRDAVGHIWQGISTNAGNNRDGRYAISKLNRFSYNIDQTLTYRPKAIGNHRYSILGGIVYNHTNSEKNYTRASNYSPEGQANRGRDFFGASIIEDTVYNFGPERMLSFLGRATYGYKNRYKLSASLRYDGSSKFIGKNRYGLFPAISAAWEIHKESFISNSDTPINELKLRVGYGETGNQRVGNNLTFVNYRISPEGYAAANKDLELAYEKTNIASKDLTWETQKQFNTGLDLGMFNGRLNVTVDAYDKTSDDLLNTLSIGGSAGDDAIVINQGGLNNRGVEVAINGDVLRTEDFTWNLFGTYSINKIEIQNLGLEKAHFGSAGEFVGYYGRPIQVSNTNTVPMNLYLEGEAPGLLFGFETDGVVTADDIAAGTPTIFGNPAEEGFYKIADKNGDGNITNEDKVIIGDPNPDFIYSFGTNINFKRWSLSANFYGVVGNDIYNANYLTENYSAENRWNNTRLDYELNRYSSSNTSGTLPDVNLQKATLDQAGVLDVAVSDGSYLRLQNLNVGYTFPMNRSGITSIKVFGSMSNVFTITNYNGVEPEISSLRFTPGVAGVDIATPPNQRSVTIGGALTF